LARVARYSKIRKNDSVVGALRKLTTERSVGGKLLSDEVVAKFLFQKKKVQTTYVDLNRSISLFKSSEARLLTKTRLQTTRESFEHNFAMWGLDGPAISPASRRLATRIKLNIPNTIWEHPVDAGCEICENVKE